MSATAVISYNSLRDASSEARQVATKLNTYANHLNSSVYRKLNSYNGNYTGNIAAAKSGTNNKISELRQKSQAFTNYANDLSDLKDKCQSTDRAVRSMVSRLTASFKRANGIRNSNVENTINYFLTGLSNSTSAGRWVGNQSDKVDSVKDYIKQSLKDWWDYEGGEEVVKGGVKAILEIAEGVCAVILGVIALLSAGSVLAAIVAIAGVIGGVIAAVNGGANLINEGRAYDQTHNNEDPARGSRLSDEDTVQDYLREETDSQFWHDFATGIDTVEFVCDVIDLGDSGVKLTKNAYKWTTGSLMDVKNLRMKDILTKNNFSSFINKIKTSFRFENLKNMKSFGDDFTNNIKEFSKGYTNFSSLKDGTKTVKNWSSISKTLFKGDFSADTIFIDVLFKKGVLPNIGLAKISTYIPSNGKVKDSIISPADITGNLSSIKNLLQSGNDILDNLSGSGNVMDRSLLDKLSESCDFSISVPNIHIPEIHVKVS